MLEPGSRSRKQIYALTLILTFIYCGVKISQEEESKHNGGTAYVRSEELGDFTNDQDASGKPVVVNTFIFEGGTRSAFLRAKDIIASTRNSRLSLSSAPTLRFVGKTKLIDRLGRETIEPVLMFEFDMADVKQANLDNLGTSGLMRLAYGVEVLHPAIKNDLLEVCDDSADLAKSVFCRNAAVSLYEHHWLQLPAE
jgi:hypothetical protein